MLFPTARLFRFAALITAVVVAAVAGNLASAHEGHGKPALLQTGTCDALGAAAFTLTGVGAEESADGVPVSPAIPVGPDAAADVTASITTVAVTVDQIVEGGHALVVYLSDEEMDTPIACGAVGGILVGEELVVGLDPVGDHGQTGIALLRTVGAEATVSIFLTDGHAEEEGHSHDEEESPESSPAA